MAEQSTSNLDSEGGKKRERRANPMPWEARLFLSPGDVADAMSISRSKAYELIATGALPGAIRIGASLRIPTAALIAWAEAQQPAQGGK